MKNRTSISFTNQLSALAAAGCLSAIAATSASAAITIFEDDFEDTSAFVAGDTDATKQTNLNSGVATGSWSVTNGNNANIGTDSSNKALVIRDNNFDITSTFSQAGVVGANATTIRFDFAIVRENGDKRTSFIGLQGATSLFSVDVIAPGKAGTPATGGQGGVQVTTDSTTALIEYNQGGISPGNFVNSHLHSMTITLSATSFDVWVDIDGNDAVDTGELLASLAYTNNPTTGITGMQILENGAPTNIGVAFDNYLVTTIPEPSTALLGGLGLLALLRRR